MLAGGGGTLVAVGGAGSDRLNPSPLPAGLPASSLLLAEMWEKTWDRPFGSPRMVLNAGTSSNSLASTVSVCFPFAPGLAHPREKVVLDFMSLELVQLQASKLFATSVSEHHWALIK